MPFSDDLPTQARHNAHSTHTYALGPDGKGHDRSDQLVSGVLVDGAARPADLPAQTRERNPL